MPAASTARTGNARRKVRNQLTDAKAPIWNPIRRMPPVRPGNQWLYQYNSPAPSAEQHAVSKAIFFPCPPCTMQLYSTPAATEKQDRITIKLIKKRKEKGISQQKLATLINVPQSTVARIEAEIISPRLETLILIANVLDVKIDIK